MKTEVAENGEIVEGGKWFHLHLNESKYPSEAVDKLHFYKKEKC